MNQSSFVEKLVQVVSVKKPAAAKDAKLLGTAVGEFYQAVYNKVAEIFKQRESSTPTTSHF